MTDTFSTTDAALKPVANRVFAGTPLTREDGIALYASRDLHAIGRLAHPVRTRLHGDRTYYNRNRHINYTNVCALSCKFCSFYRKRGEEGAYEMPVEQVVEMAVKAAAARGAAGPTPRGAHPRREVGFNPPPPPARPAAPPP